MRDSETAAAGGSAFEFTATWRDYAPIALSNLALTIVTLGVYRFWAKARERRYLWSHTRFIDDRLEWTGTGTEMFVGFLIVAVVLAPALLFVNFGLQAMVLRGQGGLAAVLVLGLYLVFGMLYGFARFRALRYRLSRSWWHGIRGGSDDPGFTYAWSSLWKNVVGTLALALLVPWAMTRLWNERWSAMSFGSHDFQCDVTTQGLKRRWVAIMAVPVVAAIMLAILAGYIGDTAAPGSPPTAGMMAGIIFSFILIYALVALIGLGYYAAFLRNAIDELTLGGLHFSFGARSKDWLLLFLGDVALVIGTLGIGIAFLGYRHWSFLIRHLDAAGAIDLDTLKQSETRSPTDAEGFATAFDVGAI